MLFTLALFLSGYTLQQRTLNDLRAAIRPDFVKPSPRAHLPDYFQRTTTTLDDGTVIVGPSEADRDEQMRIAKKYELQSPDGPSRDTTETVKPPAAQQQKEKPLSGDGHGDATQEQLRTLSLLQIHAAKQAWGVAHPDPLAKNPLPISRAERRRLIKEEIQRLAQDKKPLYYQRRLW